MHRQIKPTDFLAIIFDMDGLVLDTEKTYSRAWQKAANEMGYEFTDEFCSSMSGLQSYVMEQLILNCFGTDFDLQQFNHLSGAYWREHVNLHGIPVKKGFFNLLYVLKVRKTPYCLATNSHLDNANECLQLANLSEIFSCVITRDHVKQGKPAPDIILSAAKALNLPAAQCLVLEDSATGIQAALKAGSYTAFIPSILPVDSETANKANYVFNNLDELAQMLSEV